MSIYKLLYVNANKTCKQFNVADPRLMLIIGTIQIHRSIFRRLFFNLINHKHGHRALVHLQFQAELLIDRVKK